MKFLFNKSKKNNDDSCLSIDIGTEYVKVALFTVENKEINIWGYAKTKQKESSMRNAQIVDLLDVIDVVDLTIGQAIRQAQEKFAKTFLPKKVVLGIAGELVRGISILVDVDREAPDSEITSDELDTLLTSVSEHTFNTTILEIAEEIMLEPQNIQEIDIAVDSVYIDGVKVQNPLGLKGSEITYRVFSTFAPKVHYNSIKSVAEKLGLEILKVVVQPYALANGLMDSKDPSQNCIIIDVGGGTTDIALIKNGDLIGTKMFAIGGRTFTKRIQQQMTVEYEKAEKLKLEYSNDRLTKNEVADIRPLMIKETDIWLRGVHIALEDFEEIEELPTKIYICGGGALLPEIRSGLIEYAWTDVLPFPKHPKIEFFFPNKIRDLVDNTKSATEPMDVTPLALARATLSFNKD